jgi:LysM repeat protein
MLAMVLAAVFGVLFLTQPASAQSTTTGSSPVIVAAGDIANCYNQEDYETAYLLDITPGTVLALGDNAYEIGSLEEYNACFGPTWGRHKDRIYPVPGNHEYGSAGANGYFAYFGDRATPLEPGCRSNCKGYYSFDIGDWHVVALNSEISGDPGSEQDQWLRADLAANPRLCTLAFWHRPYFSSGRPAGSSPGLFKTLYDYGADVLLVGHEHNYERFAPQDPSGQVQHDRGIRQFVVGTGGDPLSDFRFIQPNSEVRNSETFGVLKMTLHPDGYDWVFMPISGQTFTDSGSAKCVTAGQVPPAPVSITTAPAPATSAAPAADVVAPTTTAPATPSAPAQTTTSGSNYIVQAGDTLSTIGARFGVPWTTIAAANGLSESSIIRIGQTLRLPGVTNTAATAATTAPAAATTGTPQSKTYTVQAGDTLLAIAVRNSVNWRILAAANGLSEDERIVVGQVLTIPAAGTTTTTGTTTSATPTTTTAPATATTTGAATPSTATGTAGVGRTHTVVAGDTIISIAIKYGVDWQKLLQINGLTANSIIQVGQQIRLE